MKAVSPEVRRFQIEAAHPAYVAGLVRDNWDADWTNCDMKGDPSFAPPTPSFFYQTEVNAWTGMANLWVDVPVLPLAVLPMPLNAFGIALAFPIITLFILDMYPAQRGSASSLQAFFGLLLTAVIAGVLSPLISDTSSWLALGAAAFALGGW